MIITVSLILSLSIVYSNVTYGQSSSYTITGRIKDAKTSEDIIGAKVSIKGTRIGTITNVYGIYTLKISAGIHTIVVQAFGYEPREEKVTIKGNLNKNFFLQEKAYEAKEITVSSKQDNENVTGSSMGTTTLPLSQVKRLPSFLGETDIIRSLLLQPGVSSATDLVTGFNVRGGNTDQNLILLDGATLFSPFHFLGLFSTFNGSALKSATLYKSSIPIEYGGRLSSVLDVRQRDGSTQFFSGELSIGLLSSSILLEGPIVKDKASFLISARRSYLDLFLLAASVENIEIYFFDINAKINYEINAKNRLYLSFYIGQDHAVFSIGNTGNVFKFDYGNTAGTLRWNHLFTNDLFVNFTFSYGNYFWKSPINISITGASKNADTLAFFIKLNQDISTYTLRSDFVYTMTNDFIIKFGAEIVGHSIIPGQSIIEVTSKSFSDKFVTDLQNQYGIDASIYGGVEHDVTENLKIDYGVRFSTFWSIGPGKVTFYENSNPFIYDQETGIASRGKITSDILYNPFELISFYYGISPRISARYLISEAVSIKGSYGWIHQNYHVSSISSIGLPIDTRYISNYYIKPQASHNFSLGYFQNFFDNILSTSLEGYFRLFSNLLDYIEGGNVIQNPNIETAITQGNGRAYGIEVSLQKNRGRGNSWIDNLSGAISYTYSVSEIKVANDVKKGLPDIGEFYPTSFDKTHGIKTYIIYDVEKWAFSASFTYQTNIPVNLATSSFLANKSNQELTTYGYYGREKNANRLSDYHRLDVSATYKTEFNLLSIPIKCDLSLGLFNAYAHLNPIGTLSVDGQLVEFGTPGVPIPNISAIFKF